MTCSVCAQEREIGEYLDDQQDQLAAVYSSTATVLGGREHCLPIVLVNCAEELYCTGEKAFSMKTSSLLTQSLRSIPTKPNQTYYVPSHRHPAAHSSSESMLFLIGMSLTRTNIFLYSLADYYLR